RYARRPPRPTLSPYTTLFRSGHADHDVLDAVAAGALDHRVQPGDQRIAAFQREALLADVLGVQVAFQALGGGEPLQGADLFFPRSEEHTSELQSRENLVCRLL